MNKLLPILLAALALSACTDWLDTDVGPRDDLAMMSEACRAAAEMDLSRHGMVNGESSADRAAMFDKNYRACMASKGYSGPM